MTYSFTNPEHTTLRETAANGKTIAFSLNSGSPAWNRYVDSGETAAPYVAPPEPATPTTEEKLNNLLSDYGLSREELKAAIYEEESN